jgi:hypothetical protein
VSAPDWPLDLALDRLRAHRLPYKWVKEGAWESVCPACRAPEWGLRIREPTRGGPITLRCTARCEEQKILAALLAEPVDDRVNAALALAEEASRVAHEAVALLQGAV